MRLLCYSQHGEFHLGIKTDAGIVPSLVSTQEFYLGGLDQLDAMRQNLAAMSTESVLNESTLTLAPVVPNPPKIICVGLNYRKHAEESGMGIPQNPVLFSKFNNVLAADGETIPMDPKWAQVDYEAELAVVIGKTARYVSEEAALDVVLGYCCANDLSERELQFRSGQWLLGKTPNKFLPLGRYLVTADEIPDPQNLSIKGWYNGELRQNSNTSDMIFNVAQIIAYISQYMTLSPGDVITTGTPEGVIMGMKEKHFMQPGDEYVIEIEKLGRLTNRMVAET